MPLQARDRPRGTSRPPSRCSHSLASRPCDAAISAAVRCQTCTCGRRPSLRASSASHIALAPRQASSMTVRGRSSSSSIESNERSHARSKTCILHTRVKACCAAYSCQRKEPSLACDLRSRGRVPTACCSTVQSAAHERRRSSVACRRRHLTRPSRVPKSASQLLSDSPNAFAEKAQAACTPSVRSVAQRCSSQCRAALCGRLCVLLDHLLASRTPELHGESVESTGRVLNPIDRGSVAREVGGTQQRHARPEYSRMRPSMVDSIRSLVRPSTLLLLLLLPPTPPPCRWHCGFGGTTTLAAAAAASASCPPFSRRSLRSTSRLHPPLSAIASACAPAHARF